MNIKNMPNYLFAVLAFLFVSCAQDEPLVNDSSDLYMKFFGGALAESASSVATLPDGSTVILGTSSTFTYGQGDFYVLKADKEGNVLWQKHFGGKLHDEGNDLLVKEDGTIYMFGYTTGDDGDADFTLLIADASGNLQDSLTFGRKGIVEKGSRLLAFSDGSLLFGGNVYEGNNIVDFYFYKVSSSFDSIYTSSYGFLETPGKLGGMVENTEGKALWCGTVYNTNGKSSIVAGTIGHNGIQEQINYYGHNNNLNEEALDIIPTSNNFMIGASISENSTKNMMLLETVSSPLKVDFINAVTYGFEGDQQLTNIKRTQNGNYLITGSQTTGLDNTDIFLTCVDISGEILWSELFGGSGIDKGIKVNLLSDERILLLGTSQIENNTAIALICTDKEGKLIIP